MEQNNNEKIKNELKKSDMKIAYLVDEMREIINLMNKHSDFDYGDVDSLFVLTNLLNEKMREYIKNETTRNIIKWTIDQTK